MDKEQDWDRGNAQRGVQTATKEEYILSRDRVITRPHICCMPDG